MKFADMNQTENPTLSEHLQKLQGMLQLPKMHEASLDELLTCIRYLAKSTGMTVESLPDNEGLVLIYAFLRDNYRSITIGEFKDAVDMACAGRLPNIELKLYNGILSSAYIGKLLTAYKYSEVRLKNIADLKAATPQKQIDIPQEQKQLKIIHNIRQQFEDFKADKKVFDFGSVAYNYLNSNGYLSPSADRKRSLMASEKDKLVFELKEKKMFERDPAKRIEIDRELQESELERETIRRAKLVLLIDYFKDCKEFERDIFDK
jgi:hypothetical protein